MKNSDGFTLTELMIIVSLAALLSAMAMPMLDVIVRNRLATQANDLLSALQSARSEAYKRGKSVIVCASADQQNCLGAGNREWQSGWIVFADNDNDGGFGPGDELLKAASSLAEDYTLRSSTTIFNELVYRANGRSDQFEAGVPAFVLCYAEDLTKLKAIFVAGSGRAYIGQVNPATGRVMNEFGEDVNLTACAPPS